MKRQNILVVGSGAREHALAWKLKQSPTCGEIFVAPGNGGTESVAKNVAIDARDIDALIAFAKEKRIDLTVVGPEDPLKLGIADRFRDAKLRIFGPTALAAQVETSKAFAKQMMREKGIPTAAYRIASNEESARNIVRNVLAPPIVIKANGLAAGKGAFICRTVKEANDAIDALMIRRELHDAGDTVVIEEFLEGREVSILALCDGKRHLLLPPAQDHKRLLKGDQGPMTGGMGAFAPVPWISKSDLAAISARIIQPALDWLRVHECPFIGCLFAGLMMTKLGHKVLEFNARFGDPETEVILPLFSPFKKNAGQKFDFLDALGQCADGKLVSLRKTPLALTETDGSAACVVLVSAGYPGPYDKGLPITIDPRTSAWGGEFFHAGTLKKNGKLVTNGGRVIVAMLEQPTLTKAIARVYLNAQRVDFPGKQFRKDIGDGAFRSWI